MKILAVGLACLHVCSSLSSTGTSLGTEDEWLYVGKPVKSMSFVPVKLISFVMDIDFPGEKKSWSPGHASGFILLDEQSFTVSSASGYDSQYFRYDHGVLTKSKISDLGVNDRETKASKVKMSYQEALVVSLDEGVIQGLGDVVKEIVSENSSNISSHSLVMTKLGATAEFGSSLRALTRVTWLLPSRGGDSTRRIVCKFNMRLPIETAGNGKK